MSEQNISRVAVANRGEAAVRFMRAARTWMRKNDEHMSVVAMYTTPDSEASFVKMASAVVNLGNPFVVGDNGERKSVYVDVDRVIGATLDAGCDALWPGWGFLSESPALADACEREGIVFIGPSGDSMRQMGDKIAAKRLAEDSEVPVSPWSRDPVHSPEEAREHADRIGYPVLLKAAAGGGGRGIRKVTAPDQLEEAYTSAANEAASAFGDDSIFVEKFVEVARHIEVQILADQHDNVWALGTRDCSVQRRNQKIIEEAPAPNLSDETRERICEASIRMARACGYTGAGTCEYLMLPDNETFYFLEMNTRLQVEHTCTEEIYGFDLVGAQIDVARGKPLPESGVPECRGSAVQVRLNAEDPDDNFAPRSGVLKRFATPQGPGVRVDSGYSLGTSVPSEFDSNIAKIICWGEDREEALARMQTALRDCIVALDSGLTNRSLLLELVARSEFREGPVTTGWLGEYLKERTPPLQRRYLTVALAGAAIGDYFEERHGHRLQFFAEAQNGIPRHLPDPEPMVARYRIGDTPVEVRVAEVEPERFRVSAESWTATFNARAPGDTTLILEYDGHRHSVIRVSLPGYIDIDVEGTAHRLKRTSDGRVRSALPAAITNIHVEPGDVVEVGDRLITLEVMKMEMPVQAPTAGKVVDVPVGPASQVSTGDLLVEIEEIIEEGEDEEVVVEAAPLPERPALPRNPVDVLESWFLGFDVDEEELETAREVIRTGRSGAPRDALLSLLRIYVVQDQLFQSGAFDDAPNAADATSLEQLQWFLQNLRMDEDELSDRFTRRLNRHFSLHGIDEYERGEDADEALLRMFQARSHEQSKASVVLLDVFAGLSQATSTADEELDEERGRIIFEKFANAAIQRGENLLASAAWNIIYEWYDLPYQRNKMRRFSRDAVNALAQLQQEGTPPEQRQELRGQLLGTPIGALLGALPARFPSESNHGQRILRILLERFYGAVDQEDVRSNVDGVYVRRAWIDRGRGVAAVLLPSAYEAARASAAVPDDVEELDIIVAAPPEEAQLEELIEPLEGLTRATVMWGTVETGLRARTFTNDGQGALTLDEKLTDLHPASPQAKQIGRYVNFDLTRLPASGGLWISRAVARDEPSDERYLCVGEVEQFEIQRVGPTVRVPALETVYLNAVNRLREELEKHEGRPPAWNRITLVIRPPAHISRADLEALARRMGPSSLDLGLEKIVLVGRFSLDGEPLREMAVEWSNPIGLGTRVTYTNIRLRPFVSLGQYEQSVMRARRRNLFYPYEVVGWLTSDSHRLGVQQGTFEEFDLDENEQLVSVNRPFGQNTANVVIGKISNRSQRFPEGIDRVLIIGDSTKTMGSLGEAECRRVNAAIDYADEQNLPVEWIALSAGARISFDSGTENLDWTARVLEKIVKFTQDGGVINIIVDGPCVGAQSYWNAEATMLKHCRGALIMTPRGFMVLTGKRALEYSGSVAAESNSKIGGIEIMEPNGEAQYIAKDLHDAYSLLFKHYDLTYVAPGEGYTRPAETVDPVDRNVSNSQYDGETFEKIGEIFNEETNPGRKKPFAIREVMAAIADSDSDQLERWKGLRGGETAVVQHTRLGGQPVCMIGIESQPVKRKDQAPVDGPDSWMSGTLFPQSSYKVSRALNAASGVMPAVVVANLSGFDGSPESLRNRQLEFGAEIGRAVVNFDGPVVFCVVSRYHGGAYVVFSQSLNANLEAVALDGSFASVIGGAPAAAVVFPRMVRNRVQEDDRVQEAKEEVESAAPDELADKQAAYDDLVSTVQAEVQMNVAREFDSVHSVQRAKEVGSLSDVISPDEMRNELIQRVRQGIKNAQNVDAAE